jgi:hypothetical protein
LAAVNIIAQKEISASEAMDPKDAKKVVKAPVNVADNAQFTIQSHNNWLRLE